MEKRGPLICVPAETQASERWSDCIETVFESVNTAKLDTFHGVCRNLDYRKPLEFLLEEFRRGNIADEDRIHEDAVIRSNLSEQSAAWDSVFPPFPPCPWRRTITWESNRRQRDAYLKRLLVSSVCEVESDSPLDRESRNGIRSTGAVACPGSTRLRCRRDRHPAVVRSTVSTRRLVEVSESEEPQIRA